MIGAVRLEPGDLSAMVAGLQRAWDGMREAFRALGQACVNAARKLWELVRRFVPTRTRRGDAVDRIMRRTERRRMARNLRQQRRAMRAQRRL